MDNKEHDQLFTEGYNSGYILSKYEPQLFKKVLTSSNAQNVYFSGMQAGGQAHATELFRESVQKSRALTEGHKPKMR